MSKQTEFHNELNDFVHKKGHECGLNYATIIGEMYLLMGALADEAQNQFELDMIGSEEQQKKIDPDEHNPN